MNFKDLKPGFSVFLLDKATMTFSTDKVTQVSLPHVDPKYSSPGMVVDITTESGTYCTPADTDTAYPLNKLITTDRQCILREVEAIRTTTQQRIDNIKHDEEIVTKCNNLIAELDPTQREKQATEARFNNIEASMQKMMSLLTQLTTK